MPHTHSIHVVEKTTNGKSVAEVLLSGSILSGSIESVKQQIFAQTNGYHQLRINLSNVQEIDWSALQELYRLHDTKGYMFDFILRA